MGDVQQFYSRKPSGHREADRSDGIMRDGLIRRRYSSLRALATVYTIAGYLVVAGVLIGLVIMIANSDEVSGAQFLATFLGLVVVGGLYALLAISAGQVIELLIDLQNNTHLTAQLLDDVVDALEDGPEAAAPPPSPSV